MLHETNAMSADGSLQENYAFSLYFPLT